MVGSNKTKTYQSQLLWWWGEFGGPLRICTTLPSSLTLSIDLHMQTITAELVLMSLLLTGFYLQAAITHSNGNDKDSVYFDWTAPANGTGPIRFRYMYNNIIMQF